jgi:hypothetical protein
MEDGTLPAPLQPLGLQVRIQYGTKMLRGDAMPDRPSTALHFGFLKATPTVSLRNPLVNCFLNNLIAAPAWRILPPATSRFDPLPCLSNFFQFFLPLAPSPIGEAHSLPTRTMMMRKKLRDLT